jgi:hypothetical protein
MYKNRVQRYNFFCKKGFYKKKNPYLWTWILSFITILQYERYSFSRWFRYAFVSHN